jgi:hypothetical protein
VKSSSAFGEEATAAVLYQAVLVKRYNHGYFTIEKDGRKLFNFLTTINRKFNGFTINH